jgi:hypothetical protein
MNERDIRLNAINDAYRDEIALLVKNSFAWKAGGSFDQGLLHLREGINNARRVREAALAMVFEGD